MVVFQMQNKSTVILSPRMAKLIDDTIIIGPEAVNDFYRFNKDTFPLIERSQTENVSLVTFIWMGDVTSKCVWFYSEMNPSQTPLPMNRLENTALFYLTLEIENDLRLAYAFLPNVEVNLHEDPHARIEELGRLMSTFQPDPHNPNRHVVGGTNIYFSILEMPGASRHFLSYQTEEKSHGAINEFSIDSKILNENRKIYIYTPYGYESSKEYGFLLVFDGQMYLDTGMNLPIILDNLISNNKIQTIIAVFVDSLDISQRNRDLMCSESFTHFIENELLPWIKNNYTIATDPFKNALLGASLGGMYALYFAIKNPQIFPNVLTNSAGFWCGMKKFDDQLDDSEQSMLNIYMDYGSLEDTKLMKNLNQIYADKLRHVGCQVKLHEFKGGHNYYSWRETIGEGLEFLLAFPGGLLNESR